MNDAELRAALDDAHARAVQAARAAREADEPRRQLQWYALFEESLRVAGLAAALRDPERLQNALENAAAAAAAVFALHDSTASPREDLETDTSMTNPWVWVHGLEAAIASGRRELERDLLNIPGARL